MKYPIKLKLGIENTRVVDVILRSSVSATNWGLGCD
jgi:hypothetical protein